jgi:hypothetical protein
VGKRRKKLPELKRAPKKRTRYLRLETYETDETPESWLWCLHCERCYRLKDVRTTVDEWGDVVQLCFYPDCHGSSVIHGISWSDVREYYPSFPEEPQMYVVYPQFPTPEQLEAISKGTQQAQQ